MTEEPYTICPRCHTPIPLNAKGEFKGLCAQCGYKITVKKLPE